MLTRIYKLLLHLYPDSHRSTFGPEMVSVFEQTRANAGRHGAIHRAAFILREISALICDASRAQMESAPSCGEPWIWSFEAPIVAILLYAFWVWRSEEMGVWGFFFPGTYLVVIGLGGLGAWVIGRECFVIGRWHRWRRAVIVFSVLGLALPIAARAVESAWARYLLAQDAGFAFHLPGIQVVVTDGLSDQGRKQGLTFSRIMTHSDGRPMMMLHHTNGDTPPYLLFGALAAGALALKSRRTAHAGCWSGGEGFHPEEGNA
jgi:hypothetical protein